MHNSQSNPLKIRCIQLCLVATATSAETAVNESPMISLGYPNPNHAFTEDLSNLGQ